MSDLIADIRAQVAQNQGTKRNKSKFVSKLRRWQTKHCGGRAERVALLNENPCIVVKGMVVK